MGNLKSRARVQRKSSFPFLHSFVPQIFHPLQSSSRRVPSRFQGDEYSLEGNNDRGGFGLRA